MHTNASQALPSTHRTQPTRHGMGLPSEACCTLNLGEDVPDDDDLAKPASQSI
jgi:hypothetical protein